MDREQLLSIADELAKQAEAIREACEVMAERDIPDVKVLHGTPITRIAERTLRLFVADLNKKIDESPP